MVIWIMKSIWSSLKVSDYLAKKKKSSNSKKYYIALIKLAYLGSRL